MRAWLPVLLLACSTKQEATPPAADSAVEDTATTDTAVPNAPACIKSPTPTPFPTGACESPKPASPDAFDEALAKVSLDRCTFGFNEKQVPASGWDIKDERRLPDFEPLLLRPLRLPSYGRETAKWLDEAVASEHPVSRAIAAMAARRGAPVTTCPDGAWFVLPETDPLATALNELGADGSAASTLPVDLQNALVPIVRAIAFAHAEVIAARGTIDARNMNQLTGIPSWVIGTRKITLDDDFLNTLDKVDLARITAASVQLATTIELGKLSRFAGKAIENVELDTPFGAIVIHGGNKDEYKPGSKAEISALLLDLGGDDVYRVPIAAATSTRPISIAIDLGGKDTYGYVEKATAEDPLGTRLPSDSTGRSGGRTNSRIGRQGSAIMGIGLSYDFGTDDDSYRSLAVSQGVGVLGVGVLFDEGGNDKYESETLSQGAAAWGIGLLLDRAGNDTYRGYNEMQGFGATQGIGALVDLAGGDVYYMNPGDPAIANGDPLYASAQLPGKGNTTMGQGCGYGRRSDTVAEGIGFLGGLGILRDAAGDDQYTGSVFAQGCGFLGFGALLEGSGNDTYEGLWYVQGSTAHLGIALFHDAGGNDKYNPTFPIAATSIGVGHDFSVSVHLDEGGDDAYRGPNLALGSGHANGLGVLVNVGGKDSFKAAGNFSLGGAAAGEVFMSSRGKIPTFGVFVKAGGEATYEVAGAPVIHSGDSWSYAPENAGDAGPSDAAFVEGPAKSVGVDRPSGTAALP
jgi:hypothetical protein